MRPGPRVAVRATLTRGVAPRLPVLRRAAKSALLRIRRSRPKVARRVVFALVPATWSGPEVTPPGAGVPSLGGV